MSQHKSYLKIEAVNIYNTILDTNQLSVIRGSSHLLKDAIEKIEHVANDACNEEKGEAITAITLGGSTGIFEVIGLSLEKAESLAWQVLNQAHDGLAFTDMFSFTVNTASATDYLTAKEILFAKGRHDQATQFSSAILPVQQHTAHAACALNGVLPADVTSHYIKAAKGHAISRSTHYRYQYGKKLRTSLYNPKTSHSKEEHHTSNEYAFPNDLEALAGTHDVLSLNGKVAVIYADGNSFGKIQRNIIKSKMGNAEQIQAQRDFDVALKAKRDAYLQSLVQFLHIQGAIQFDEGGSFIPLETLLWGGDEMTIVVPAWLGFRVLDHFISGYGTFDIDENTLTHSIGMVFCSHKTPIQKAQTAAISLADNIKSLENGRSRTYFDYMVLESIDYPTQALSEFWQAQYGEIAKYRTPLALTDTFRLGGNGDPNICPNLKNQLDALPRASMYHLVEQAIATQAAEIEAQGSSSQQEKANRKGTTAQLGDVLNKVLHSNGEDHHESIKHLLALFTPLSIKVKDKEEDEQPTIETPREYQNTDTLFWIHLLELYDYLAPEPPKTTHYQAGGHL